MLIKYQRDLNLRYGAWLTVVTGICITGLAIASGVKNDFPYSFKEEDITGRGIVVGIWIFFQVIFIAVGVVMKVVLPCSLPHALLLPCIFLLAVVAAAALPLGRTRSRLALFAS